MKNKELYDAFSREADEIMKRNVGVPFMIVLGVPGTNEAFTFSCFDEKVQELVVLESVVENLENELMLLNSVDTTNPN